MPVDKKKTTIIKLVSSAFSQTTWFFFTGGSFTISLFQKIAFQQHLKTQEGCMKIWVN